MRKASTSPWRPKNRHRSDQRNSCWLIPSFGSRLVHCRTEKTEQRVTCSRGGEAISIRLAVSAKSQVGRHAALAFGFAAVAGHGVAVPWLAPVDRAFRGP